MNYFKKIKTFIEVSVICCFELLFSKKHEFRNLLNIVMISITWMYKIFLFNLSNLYNT